MAIRDNRAIAEGMDEQKKQIPDWERIESEYRAGQLSLREIARQHGITEGAIRKRAKKESWVKDLSRKVQEKVRSELVRSEVRTPNAKDHEIIEAAAARAVEVVRQHRRDIANLQRVEQKLLAELGDEENPPTKVHITAYQGTVTKTVLGITVTERSSALQALAAVQHKRIALERQAFSLGDEDPTDDLKTTSTEDLEAEARALARQIVEQG